MRVSALNHQRLCQPIPVGARNSQWRRTTAAATIIDYQNSLAIVRIAQVNRAGSAVAIVAANTTRSGDLVGIKSAVVPRIHRHPPAAAAAFGIIVTIGSIPGSSRATGADCSGSSQGVHIHANAPASAPGRPAVVLTIGQQLPVQLQAPRPQPHQAPTGGPPPPTTPPTPPPLY